VIIQFILVFLAVTLADILWTKYFLATSREQEHIAGLYSAGIILVGSFITRSYVHDGIMIIPAVLGAYVGTAGTIYYHKWENKNVTSE